MFWLFWTFWLRNVLRATTAPTFSTSQLPTVLRTLLADVLCTTTACTFSSLIWPDGSAPAALASLLFDPPEPQIIGKTKCFVTFLHFWRIWASFFWLFLFSDLLSSTLLFSLTLPVSAFHLSILSEVWLLNFLRLQYIPSIWINHNTEYHHNTNWMIKNLPSLNSNQVQWIDMNCILCTYTIWYSIIMC